MEEFCLGTCSPGDGGREKTNPANLEIPKLRGNVCPAQYLCIEYPTLAPSLSSPREVPQVDRTRPENLPCKARSKYENSTTQYVTPTTTLAIIINWVQRTDQILRLFGEGGQKQARVGNGKKKMPGAHTAR